MNLFNPYQIRYYTQISLCVVIISFFAYTTIDQLIHKQFYIKRYVEIFYEFSSHRMVTTMPPLNLSLNEDDNEILILDDEILNQTIYSPKKEYDHSQQENDVKAVSSAIVAIILAIEMIYCFIFIYIVLHPMFCPVTCFATFSLISLSMRLYQYVISETEYNSTLKHHSSNFLKHVNSLDVESTWNHIASTNVIELSFATVETVLAIIFAVIIRKYPFLNRNNRQVRLNHNRTAMLNGNVVEMREFSEEPPGDNEENAILMEQNERIPRVIPPVVQAQQ